MTYGAITPGMAMDARIAWSSGPRCSHTDRPAIRSVVTAVYGNGNSSMVTVPSSSRTASRILPARSTPAAEIDGSSSRSMAGPVKPVAHSVNSSREPAANRPPTSAPIEDPDTPTTS